MLKTLRLSRLIPTCGLAALLLLLVLVSVSGAGEARTQGRRSAPQPQVFSATVEVLPSTTQLQVGQTLVVTVDLTVSEGCQFPVLELTLGQSAQVFAHVSPPSPVVHVPGRFPFTYTLAAVGTGEVVFGALLFGERYCGDFWVWHYEGGQSEPVTVLGSSAYLPLALCDGVPGPAPQ